MSQKTRSRRKPSDRDERVSLSPFLLATLAVLLLSILLGGASRLNQIPATVVEVASLAMIPWAAFRLARIADFSELRVPMLLMIAGVAIPLLQIIPLPPELWTTLPTGARAKHVYEVAGIGLDWRPMSLTPQLTLRSGLALAAPFAMFLAFASLSFAQRRLGLIVILVGVALGLVLGALQVGGSGSFGYLYESTNRDALVGLFSNRNHQASLLLCALPLLAALLATSNRASMNRTNLIMVSVGMTIIVVAALAVVRSRMGVILFGPSAAMSALILLLSGRFGNPSRVALILFGILAAVLALVAWFGLDPLLARFQGGVSSDGRFEFYPDIFRAGLEFIPTGSGLGSFDAIYRSVERLEIVQPAFLNHAHNDYLELFLEAGFAAVVVILLFIVWWTLRAWSAWKGRRGDDAALAQAGAVVIALLLAHSVFDYPLRTLAMSAVFGFACSLMIAPKKPLRPR